MDYLLRRNRERIQRREGLESLLTGVSDWRKYEIAFGRRRVLSAGCLASYVVQGSDAPAGSNALRQADLASIEKFHKQDIAATFQKPRT
jgi:hypothetical protein